MHIGSFDICIRAKQTVDICINLVKNFFPVVSLFLLSTQVTLLVLLLINKMILISYALRIINVLLIIIIIINAY